MYKCDFCGRESSKKIRYGGHTVCSKHMHQLHKYGKVLDNNPRTNNDLNDYEIKNNLVYFNLYNQKNEKIGQFFIDIEDIEKVKYHKWRVSHGHIVTGQPAKKQQKDLSWIILGIDSIENGMIVDHVDGNPSNNTRENLRYCSQSENTLNKNFTSNNTSGFIGVSFQKSKGRFDPEIRRNGIRCHLGYTKTLEEAVYKRYLAEQIVFGEFANSTEQNKKYEFTKNLPQNVKDDLKKIVEQKLKSKNLWQ